MEAPVSGTELQPDTELFTINMGPHHPATHGVLRLLLTLEGETVLDMEPIIGYVHTGHREVVRGPGLLEGHPVRRADGLPLVLLQRDGVLHVGRAAARPRGAAARAVPAGDPSRAEPDREPPVLARHLRARPRRGHDALVGLPRARLRARPVRVLVRPALPHALLPGRRRHRGHPAGLGAEGARVLRAAADAARPVRGAARPQRDLPPAAEGRRRSSTRRRCSSWA